MAKLGDICTVVSGSTPKTGVAEYWDGTVKWITPAELNEDSFYITDSVRHITEDGKEKTGLSYLPKGTVILSSRAPIGKTAIAGCEMCCNQGFKNLICSDAVYNEYLYFFLKSKTNYLNSLGRGATFKEISKSIVEKIEIPLPNIEKQHQIVKELKATRNLIAHRKQQLTKLDELIKARFVEMFGDFKSNSKGWSIVKFDEFAQIDGNMTTDYEKYADYPHIGIDSIEKETGTLKGYRTVKEDGVVSGKYFFTPQHIIYSKIRPNLNKVALPDFEGLCSADAYPILPNPKNCNRVFLALAMRSNYFLDYILQFSARTNLPKVNRKEIAGFSMPLPPLPLQNQFADFVAEVDKSKLFVGSAAAHKPFDIGFFSQKHCATPCKRGIISSKHMIFH